MPGPDGGRGDAPLLEVDGVAFDYAGHPVLRGVSFSVRPSEFVALTGANGSGKTTLLRAILGLHAPSSGSIRLLGRSPRALRERWRIGYVPQRPDIAPDLPASVREVVEAGRLARSARGRFARFGLHRRLRDEDRQAVTHALDAVALTDFARRRVDELSGGERQRVFIAKALASNPDLLVLDEPVAGVDVLSQQRFRDSLVHLARVHGSAVLLVSHELGAVADDLDRVLLLRSGSIVFDGAPAELTARGVSLGVHADDLPLWLEAPG